MKIEEFPLALGEPADVDSLASLDAHALQRREVRHQATLIWNDFWLTRIGSVGPRSLDLSTFFYAAIQILLELELSQ